MKKKYEGVRIDIIVKDDSYEASVFLASLTDGEVDEIPFNGTNSTGNDPY